MAGLRDKPEVPAPASAPQGTGTGPGNGPAGSAGILAG